MSFVNLFKQKKPYFWLDRLKAEMNSNNYLKSYQI